MLYYDNFQCNAVIIQLHEGKFVIFRWSLFTFINCYRSYVVNLSLFFKGVTVLSWLSSKKMIITPGKISSRRSFFAGNVLQLCLGIYLIVYMQQKCQFISIGHSLRLLGVSCYKGLLTEIDDSWYMLVFIIFWLCKIEI